VRRALLQAAAEVVGEVGYADASISSITQRCGIAQGTFYNYFKSRQDLFDQLLPDVGSGMREPVREWELKGQPLAGNPNLGRSLLDASRDE
jgi:AcrR family transcriptional regulator